MSQGPAVDVDDLVMRYGDKVAVDHLSLQIPRGVIAAVLGRNGVGKTTTLETCEGYRRPQQGTVRVLGLDPVAQHHDLTPHIGVMLQEGGAWGGVRATEMLTHLARLHAHPLPVDLLVDRLSLGECGRTPYRRLSGGQKQRLSLAMALIGRPELLFVDEPTAGMDVAARHTTWDLLRELREDGATVVLTTHYLDEAEALADEVHIIDAGRLVASGSPSELGALAATSIRLAGKQPLPTLPEFTAVRVDAVDERTAVFTGEGVTMGLLAAIVTWCEAQGVTPETLTFGQRDLEEVFLSLTGSGDDAIGGAA